MRDRHFDLAADRHDVATVIASRDDAAFRRLYARHTPALYALARRLMGGRTDDADDIVQEVWLRAVPKFAVFAWDSSVRTWLAAFALNCCRERWRERGESLLTDDLMMSGAVPDLPLRLDLERALAALPVGYRAVVVLHDIEGYTHEEIATKLGVEVGTSKSQLSRARRALRRGLTRGEADGTHG
jgi:RNA polymerase sigma-70 factor, ECF subfamily